MNCQRNNNLLTHYTLDKAMKIWLMSPYTIFNDYGFSILNFYGLCIINI